MLVHAFFRVSMTKKYDFMCFWILNRENIKSLLRGKPFVVQVIIHGNLKLYGRHHPFVKILIIFDISLQWMSSMHVMCSVNIFIIMSWKVQRPTILWFEEFVLYTYYCIIWSLFWSIIYSNAMMISCFIKRGGEHRYKSFVLQFIWHTVNEWNFIKNYSNSLSQKPPKGQSTALGHLWTIMGSIIGPYDYPTIWRLGVPRNWNRKVSKQSQAGSHGAKWVKMGLNLGKWGQMGSNGIKRGPTGSNRATRG